MILYHFPTSPYARRVRLALAMKGQQVELRDARAHPESMQDVRRLNPMHTVPVLVDGGHVVSDSTAICHYLDRKQPAPPLWPAGLAGARAFALTALCDGVIDTLANLGMRCAPLHDHPSFLLVKEQLVGRAQRALEQLASEVVTHGQGDATLCGGGWSGADIAVFSLVQWLERLPGRAQSYAPVRPLLALGWSLPAALAGWAALHARRPDVLALDSQ
jgi:glutathione S-transferase